ncbi:MAG: SDR family NAD(P)-dependent oxidoreductase [Pseudomonadales bacterium]
MASNKAVVIGVGPERGLGGALCKRFAAEGLHVFVAGRTAKSLELLAAAIRELGGEATAVVADTTDEAAVVALFDQVVEATGEIALAVYNAGNNTPGRIVDMDTEYVERAWRVGCFGGFLFGREAVKRMLPRGGTLIFTGASASLRGRAGFGAFSAAKGALRNLAQAMAKEYGEEGLHVAHVVIDGGIAGDKIINRFPDMVKARGEGGLINLEGLAAAYWFLHQQPRDGWSFEVDLRTSKENW